MIMYGLRIKGKKDLLKVSTQSNSDGEYCTDIQHILEDSNLSDYPLWLVPTKEMAEKVSRSSTEWYNAGYDTPSWPNYWRLHPVELEVVMVELKIWN